MTGTLAGAADTATWLPYRRPEPAAALRLICLPFAGGGASRFLPLARALEPAAEVLAVQFPGRENRLDEPAYTEAGQLIEELAAALGPLLDRPYALLGYSLGALYGFELVRRLAAQHLPAPLALFAVAAPAPHCRGPERLSELSDAELFAQINSYQSIPAELAADPALTAMSVNAFRTDLGTWERYRHLPDTTVSCPICVYHGREDSTMDRAQKVRWRERTTAATRFRQFEGGHFFGFDQPAELARALRTDLALYTREALS